MVVLNITYTKITTLLRGVGIIENQKQLKDFRIIAFNSRRCYHKHSLYEESKTNHEGLAAQCLFEVFEDRIEQCDGENIKKIKVNVHDSIWNRTSRCSNDQFD